MKTIFVNDIPIFFKPLNNLKLKKEDFDTHVDGSSGIVPKKLYSRVLIYDSTITTIVDLLKKMTSHKFKKIYSITITLKDYKTVLKKVKKMFKIVKAGGGVACLQHLVEDLSVPQEDQVLCEDVQGDSDTKEQFPVLLPAEFHAWRL